MAEYEENPFGTIGPSQNNFEFILNASLDSVDAKQWVAGASQHLAQAHMYLGSIDKYNDMFVSCLQTAGNAKFLLLHENHKQEDQIKQFFNEAFELYVKVVVNPFYDPEQRIAVPQFDDKIKRLAQKCF